MSRKKGSREYEAFLRYESLSRKKAMSAQCYQCNGEEEGGVDCKGNNCPLYQYFPYKGK